MVRRKFSIERLYKLIRNLVTLMSVLGVIASVITFSISKSYQNELKTMDETVKFPKEYKNRRFTNS